MKIDSNILDNVSLSKIQDLQNNHVEEIIEFYANLCKPSKVTVISDSEEDLNMIRTLALSNEEESELNEDGHTVHFDSSRDQARDKNNTRILLPKGKDLGKLINSVDRDEGLNEIMELLDGIMSGKEMLVCFFCLGPTDSKFSISALQITDSAYVAHSETILYRKGYSQFKKLNGSDNFFQFIHSAGKLDDRQNSLNIESRRVYMDLENERVFSVNTQYAGNSVGLKKLALRLAINRANHDDWLCEHMFILGVVPEGKERVTYISGAYPSACGKTSTAMVPGQMILGDDIAYLRKAENGKAFAVNVEQGIFGIIQDVNAEDDPLIYKTIRSPGELIFSNILVNDNNPYWLGMGEDIPDSGFNFAGEWEKSNLDEKGNSFPFAHKNARYTIRISELSNCDPKLHDPNGVPLSGIIYGGRDSDTNPPVIQSFDWKHGVFMGAILESETTAATLGAEGEVKHNPMANLDFLVVPMGTYIENHLKFGESLDDTPLIFSTNYFLKENGEFLNEKLDKKVWLMWMEGRIHNEFDAITTPIGFIPIYDDLSKLFSDIFQKGFSESLYQKLFSIRIKNHLDRIDRIEAVYNEEPNLPQLFIDEILAQKKRLSDARSKHGTDVILPVKFI